MNETVQLINNLEALRLSLASFSNPNDETQRQAIIDSLAALGVDYEPETKIDDGLSDNRNDENYRYADTGYIAGSAKEMASNRIKQLAKEGVAVKVKDIDWDQIEDDPLMAESLIKKSNIIGKFDYSELKDNGIQANTAYLIEKVLTSVAKEPYWDLVSFAKKSPSAYNVRRDKNLFLEFARKVDDLGAAAQKQMMRKAYVAGIDTLKDRISKCVTPRDLYNELKQIGEELRGSMLSGDTQKRYQKASNEREGLLEQMEKESQALYEEALPDLKEIVKSKGMREIEYNYKAFLSDWVKEKYPNRNYEFKSYIGSGVVDADKMKRWRELDRELRELTMVGGFEALTTDRSVQQWVALGERFWAIVEMQSNAFIKHLNLANSGKYNDWSLTIKDEKTKPGKKKGTSKPTFELIVADSYERKGGKEVSVNSTSELKDMFGFRDIQSGNWVLDDKSSAEFHVKNTAAAMMDLSDIVGIDPKSLAFGGRLALAIGARGRKGAMAHYEPAQRVINLTKMKGGGALGHEWFHAIDNILGEVLGNEDAVGVGVYLSEKPELAGNPELTEAFQLLQDVMDLGTNREPETFKVKQEDVDLAKRNITEERLRINIVRLIYEGDAQSAIIAVDDYFRNPPPKKRTKDHKLWRRIAIGYHNQDKVDQEVTLFVGNLTSSFKQQSLLLDSGRSKSYWSSTREMAARAFQSYLEDKLEQAGRRNDYLSFGANNSLYSDDYKAYPEGEERELINKAFDILFEVIKRQKIFENTTKDEAMMDSIFGPQSLQSLDHLIVW